MPTDGGGGGAQMDAQEFLNMLFDRIDTKVKGTPQERALKEVLGGVFSNEFIGKCKHHKEREEEFYAVSLNVKNKKTLQESLQDFVKGEPLEGDNAYRCDACNKKVDTLKRTSLKKLPPTIIFHLKRFEFNFDTMQKIKVPSAPAALRVPTPRAHASRTRAGQRQAGASVQHQPQALHQ
jgi:ubiquitin C-terminal hydrolase